MKTDIGSFNLELCVCVTMLNVQGIMVVIIICMFFPGTCVPKRAPVWWYQGQPHTLIQAKMVASGKFKHEQYFFYHSFYTIQFFSLIFQMPTL